MRRVKTNKLWPIAAGRTRQWIKENTKAIEKGNIESDLFNVVENVATFANTTFDCLRLEQQSYWNRFLTTIETYYKTANYSKIVDTVSTRFLHIDTSVILQDTPLAYIFGEELSGGDSLSFPYLNGFMVKNDTRPVKKDANLVKIRKRTIHQVSIDKNFDPKLPTMVFILSAGKENSRVHDDIIKRLLEIGCGEMSVYQINESGKQFSKLFGPEKISNYLESTKSVDSNDSVNDSTMLKALFFASILIIVIVILVAVFRNKK